MDDAGSAVRATGGAERRDQPNAGGGAGAPVWASAVDAGACLRIQLMSAQDLIEGKRVKMPQGARTSVYASAERERAGTAYREAENRLRSGVVVQPRVYEAHKSLHHQVRFGDALPKFAAL